MYKKIDFDIDIKKLQEESEKLFSQGLTHPRVPTQIGLTYEDENCPNKFIDAVGSLDYDYMSDLGDPTVTGQMPPRRERKVTEKDFNKIVPELVGTYLGDLLAQLIEQFDIGRTRLMLLKPKTCLTWHKDSTYRMHIPIITNEGCIMVWDNCTVHMPEGSLYWVNTTFPHTAFNGTFKDRIHLVSTIETKV